MKIWKYGNMKIWKYENMKTWKHGNAPDKPSSMIIKIFTPGFEGYLDTLNVPIREGL